LADLAHDLLGKRRVSRAVHAPAGEDRLVDGGRDRVGRHDAGPFVDNVVDGQRTVVGNDLLLQLRIHRRALTEVQLQWWQAIARCRIAGLGIHRLRRRWRGRGLRHCCLKLAEYLHHGRLFAADLLQSLWLHAQGAAPGRVLDQADDVVHVHSDIAHEPLAKHPQP
jgi:hypothetical protein